MRHPKRNIIRLLCTFLGAAAMLWIAPAGRARNRQEISRDAVWILKQKVLDRINADRKQAKLPPLLYYDDLSGLADAHCREMLASNFLSHWNRAGQKSYMRYSLGGILDHTAERAGRIRDLKIPITIDTLEARLLTIHDNYALEANGPEVSRWTLLEPHHTHVGIGFAFSQTQVFMVEVFASRYVTLTKPLPERVTLSQKLRMEGRVSLKGYEIKGLSIFYEPFPIEKTLAELQSSGRSGGGEGFPKEVLLQRAILPPGTFYDDGTRGALATDGTKFDADIQFFKKLPGVYTLVVWVKDMRYNEPFFMGTTLCIFVDADK
jgi:hypothetical protein